MEITLLPLIIAIIGLVYLTNKTGVPVYQLFAGLITFYITFEFITAGVNFILILVFALLAFYLSVMAFVGARK